MWHTIAGIESWTPTSSFSRAFSFFNWLSSGSVGLPLPGNALPAFFASCFFLECLVVALSCCHFTKLRFLQLNLVSGKLGQDQSSLRSCKAFIWFSKIGISRGS